MDQTTMGFLNIGILGLSIGATISAPLIVYAKRKADEASREIHIKIDNLFEKVGNIDREIYPAVKNGSIVTSDQLDEKLEILERASERRHKHTKEMISNDIKYLKEMVERLEAKNKTDHVFTKKDLEDIMQRIILGNMN